MILQRASKCRLRTSWKFMIIFDLLPWQLIFWEQKSCYSKVSGHRVKEGKTWFQMSPRPIPLPFSQPPRPLSDKMRFKKKKVLITRKFKHWLAPAGVTYYSGINHQGGWQRVIRLLLRALYFRKSQKKREREKKKKPKFSSLSLYSFRVTASFLIWNDIRLMRR